MDFGYKHNRPVLLLAPDAVLTINQNTRVPVSRQDNQAQTYNLVDIASQITVNLNLEGGQGSAGIDLAIPRHNQSGLYGNGKVNIDLLSEVHVYMKGRFLKNGKPAYYQVFWGLVTNVEESYSDGFYTVHLNCQDMLKWWELSRVITQSSVLNSVYTSSPFRALANIFSYLTAHEIIYVLSKAMFSDKALIPNYLLGTPIEIQITLGTQNETYENALEYWKKRFNSLQVPLATLNLDPERKKVLDKAFTDPENTEADKALFKPLKEHNFLSNPANNKFEDPVARALPLYNEVAGQLDAFNLGVKSPLEVAQEVKTRINYEFFMDAGARLTFKPPYYNLRTKRNEIYTIKDNDLISYTISHNLDQIYTRIDLEGSFTADSAASNKPSTFYIDPERSQKYGIKDISKSFNFVRDTETLNYFAIAELNHINRKEYTGTITIAGRPELKLGMPVYLECEDIYAYIISISHNFDFGQSFTTNLGVECIRRRLVVPKKGTTGVRYHQISKAESADPAKQQAKLVEALKTVEAGEGKPSLVALLDRLDANTKKTLGYTEDSQKDPIKFLAGVLADTSKSSTFLAAVRQTPGGASAVTPSNLGSLLKKIDNIVAAQTTFKMKVVEEVASGGNYIHFQASDEDGYELIFGFDYGLSIDPGAATGLQETQFSGSSSAQNTTSRRAR